MAQGREYNVVFALLFFSLFVYNFNFMEQKPNEEEEHVFYGLYNWSTPGFPP